MYFEKGYFNTYFIKNYPFSISPHQIHPFQYNISTHCYISHTLFLIHLTIYKPISNVYYKHKNDSFLERTNNNARKYIEAK